MGCGGAVEAGSRHHAPFVVEEPRDRRARRALDVHGEDPDARGRVAGAVEHDLLGPGKRLAETGAERDRASVHLGDPGTEQVLGGGAETDDPGTIQRAALEPVGREVGLRLEPDWLPVPPRISGSMATSGAR